MKRFKNMPGRHWKSCRCFESVRCGARWTLLKDITVLCSLLCVMGMLLISFLLLLKMLFNIISFVLFVAE